MILGMPVGLFTAIHTLISLVAIASGLVVLFDLVAGRWREPWTRLFLLTTVLTSATGFLFPSASFGPPHIIGALSLVLLAVAIYAAYGARLGGAWRVIYVITAVLSLYLNAFVGVVQAFQKIGGLAALAPTQSEPPFAITQGIVLLLFVALGFLATRRAPRPLATHPA
jgi:hypothetical protein